jgi:hypothetical protein
MVSFAPDYIGVKNQFSITSRDPAWKSDPLRRGSASKIGSDSLLMKLRRRFAWFAGNQRHAVSSRLKVAPAWVFRCRYV